MTFLEWLGDQHKHALVQKDKSYFDHGDRKYWQGYAAALRDVRNVVKDMDGERNA